MREITHIEFKSNFDLVCQFNDNTTKLINLSEIAKSEVFQFLNDKNHITQFINKGYYIEWPKYEADLSADTLWHLGNKYSNS